MSAPADEQSDELDYGDPGEAQEGKGPSAAAGEDLYSDLFTEHGESETLLNARIAEMERRLSEQEQAMKAQASEMETVRKENAKLSEENRTLLRNISCLYRTAVEEIGRKDGQIKELRGQAQKQAGR